MTDPMDIICNQEGVLRDQALLITRLEQENEIMRNALIHINCESINAEGLSLAALKEIKVVPNV